jgi:hypothetical protein
LVVRPLATLSETEGSNASANGVTTAVTCGCLIPATSTIDSLTHNASQSGARKRRRRRPRWFARWPLTGGSPQVQFKPVYSYSIFCDSSGSIKMSQNHFLLDINEHTSKRMSLGWRIAFLATVYLSL